MTDIEIEIWGNTARTSGEGWKSEDKTTQRHLNLISSPSDVIWYSPDIAHDLLNLVKRKFPGVKVISIKNETKYDPSKVY